MSSELYYEDVEIGDDISPMERVVDRDRVVRFLRIRNEVSDPKRFTDDAYARKNGLVVISFAWIIHKFRRKRANLLINKHLSRM